METGKQGGDVTVQEGVRTASLPQKGAAAQEAEPGTQLNTLKNPHENVHENPHENCHEKAIKILY